MEKRWKIKRADEDRVQALSEALKIQPLLSRVLVARGIESFDAARDYFRPNASLLLDPMLMKDMDSAVERILRAAEKKEKCSSSAIMMWMVPAPLR
jgi:single-stranded-DNA-specific exonuclease